MNGQLELTLANQPNQPFAKRPVRRQRRALWWFDKMREVVDSAMSWQPAPQSRPEQMVLSGVHRSPMAG